MASPEPMQKTMFHGELLCAVDQSYCCLAADNYNLKKQLKEACQRSHDVYCFKSTNSGFAWHGTFQRLSRWSLMDMFTVQGH